MLELFEEALMRQEVKESNLKTVKTKSIYLTRMEDQASPPKVESKYPHTDFIDLVYPRLTHPVLEAKQKDILFSLVHGIYKNRVRLYDQDRTDDPFCPHPACRDEEKTQDIEHIFCSCYLVREAWQWIRRKVMGLQGRLGHLLLSPARRSYLQFSPDAQRRPRSSSSWETTLRWWTRTSSTSRRYSEWTL